MAYNNSLDKRGFVMNPYNPCVWNKMIKGKQSSICFHVNDCKISHENPKIINDIITWLHQDYESIFTDGSRKMEVAQGKVHNYLGMMLDFTED